MIEIKDLLLKSRHLLFSEEVKKESIKNIIIEIIGIPIKLEDIKIQDATVFLNIKPIYKSEIMLKKNQIFSKIEQTLGRQPLKSIR